MTTVTRYSSLKQTNEWTLDSSLAELLHLLDSWHTHSTTHHAHSHTRICFKLAHSYDLPLNKLCIYLSLNKLLYKEVSQWLNQTLTCRWSQQHRLASRRSWWKSALIKRTLGAVWALSLVAPVTCFQTRTDSWWPVTAHRLQAQG